ILAIGATWILVVHFIDIHWLVMPNLHRAGFSFHPLDITTLLAAGGLLVAAIAFYARKVNLVPTKAPRLEQAFACENVSDTPLATEPDQVNTSVLGTLIAVLGLGVLATALAIAALVRTQEDQMAAARSETNDELAALRGAQEADLHQPVAFIDQKAGTVRLPIDRAMEVVVRDLRRNPESATARPKAAQTNGHGDGDGAPADTEGNAPGESEAEGEQQPGSP